VQYHSTYPTTAAGNFAGLPKLSVYWIGKNLLGSRW